MSDLINIEVSLWDSGCLPQLLAKEIAAVERTIRVIGAQLSPQDKGQHEAYLGQLRACLAGVERARRA